MSARHPTICSVVILVATTVAWTAEKTQPSGGVPVGVAGIDITPDGPIRLAGYASRHEESEGIAGRLWAKALAIGSDEGEGPAVLLMVENCGLPTSRLEEMAARLKANVGLKRERFMACVTHTHTGPRLKTARKSYWYTTNPEHEAHLAQYTKGLCRRMEQVVLKALASRRPGHLAWAKGSVPLAANRRVLKNGKWVGFGVNPDGSVDHDMPILRVTDTNGKLVAVVLNYACHCTTLGGDFNKVHGDWAGYAQQFIEADHPGAVAMVCIGCGADANPKPRGTLQMAEQHGRTVADEVKRLLQEPLKPIEPRLTARMLRVELPFDKLPSRQELQQLVDAAAAADAPRHVKRRARPAQGLLTRLDREGKLPASLNYPVATWVFGDDLAMIFLGGEVVADYALRLKRELDASRIWITAYANDVPCYVASKRVLEEGGYEADSSMVFSGYPSRFSPAVEDQVVNSVRSLLPPDFHQR